MATTITIVLEMSDESYASLLPTLETAVLEDSVVGLRLKDLDGTPEHELALQVTAHVLAYGEDS